MPDESRKTCNARMFPLGSIPLFLDQNYLPANHSLTQMHSYAQYQRLDELCS